MKRIAVLVPENIKTLLTEKHIGKGELSGFFRSLLQQRFFESKIFICVECGSDQLERKEDQEGYEYYTCQDCNNQKANMGKAQIRNLVYRLRKQHKIVLRPTVEGPHLQTADLVEWVKVLDLLEVKCPDCGSAFCYKVGGDEPCGDPCDRQYLDTILGVA